MLPPGTPLTDEQQALIKTWYEAGAPKTADDIVAPTPGGNAENTGGSAMMEPMQMGGQPSEAGQTMTPGGTPENMGSAPN